MWIPRISVWFLGYQPFKNFNLYAGPAFQNIKADVSLRGLVYADLNGYNAMFKEDAAIGWLAGFAYQLPDIALKAALTYHSKIDHNINVSEKYIGRTAASA